MTTVRQRKVALEYYLNSPTNRTTARRAYYRRRIELGLPIRCDFPDCTLHVRARSGRTRRW